MDKLRLHVPVLEEDISLGDATTLRHWQDASHNLHVEGSLDVRGFGNVFVMLSTRAPIRLTIEFNPSRMMREGHGLCAYSELERATLLALRIVEDRAGVRVAEHTLQDAHVARVDVASDWVLKDARRVIAALAPLRRTHARRVSLEFSPQTGLVTGLIAGNRRSHVKLYQREEPHPQAPHLDWLRYEVKATESWLPRGRSAHSVGEVRFRELDACFLHRMLLERFEWAGFHVTWGSRRDWETDCIRQLSPSRARGLRDYLRCLEVPAQTDHGLSGDLVRARDHDLRSVGVPGGVLDERVGRLRLTLGHPIPRRANLVDRRSRRETASRTAGPSLGHR